MMDSYCFVVLPNTYDSIIYFNERWNSNNTLKERSFQSVINLLYQV
jgi:hypothetical protein